MLDKTENPRILATGIGWTALSQRQDLARYGEGNSIALFAAELILGVEDIDAFATNALTDDGNDKKCDLVAVDRDRGLIIVAQAYASRKEENVRKEAPAGKTSDLNTAVSWLLSGKTDSLPEVLRDAFIEARDALKEGEISELQIWSVHNCQRSQNVQTELDQARRTASGLLKTEFANTPVSVTSQEIGIPDLNEFYRRVTLPIVVDDTLEFNTDGGFEISGEGWSAFNTAIRLDELRRHWKKFGKDLLSPNIRDYLGVRKSEKNINYGIKNTAQHNPDEFFIYNNGITAVVHSFDFDDSTKKVSVTGLGIVNGGQTTGSIGTLNDNEAASLNDARVQVRFVKSNDTSRLKNVVKFNNTQNKVEATDFRSSDAVQERLRREFQEIPEATYKGARRGGTDNIMKRDRGLLYDNAVAQSLASFHGDPNLAYNETRKIWENDEIYSRFFNDALSAEHVLFTYSLLKSIEKAKEEITQIPADSRTAIQKTQAEFFRSKGSVHLLTAAISNSMETILGTVITSKFDVRFKSTLTPSEAISAWEKIIDKCFAFTQTLSEATNQGLKSKERVRKALESFGSFLSMARSTFPEEFDNFSLRVTTHQREANKR